jgi:hypothetical protein
MKIQGVYGLENGNKPGRFAGRLQAKITFYVVKL